MQSLAVNKIRENIAVKMSVTVFVVFMSALLMFPSEISKSITQSANYCLGVLFPSLFPFMVLTSFSVNSKVSTAIGSVFGFAAKYIFRLPKAATAAIILSFIGGYPTGAAGISLLLKNGYISKEEAGRMLLFCVNPGIAFIVTFIGGTILKNPQIGIMLFSSICISGILIGIISGLLKSIPKEEYKTKVKGSSGALVKSTADACSAIVKMSACVILFSGINAVFHGSGIYQILVQTLAKLRFLTPPQAASTLSFIIEVTSGITDAVTLHTPMNLFAFGLAFGGLCVHLQVFSFFKAFPINKIKFIAFRFLHGLISAIIYTILTRIFPQNTDFFVNPETSEALITSAYLSADTPFTWSMPLAGGFSILMMSIIFLLLVFKTSTVAENKIL